MAPPNQEQNPNGFWDFIQNLSNQPNHYHGYGVDHHHHHGHHHGPHQPPFPQFGPGFPFAGGWGNGPAGPPPPPCPPGPPGAPGASRGPWDADFDWSAWFGDGPGGREGRREWRRECRRRRRDQRHGHDGTEEEGRGEQSGRHGETETDGEKVNEKGESPDTVDADMPDPEEVAPEDVEQPPPYGFGRRGGHWGRGGHHRGRGGPHHGPGPHGRGGPRGQAPFDFQGMMRGFMNHPFFQGLREQAERYQSNNTNADDAVESFSPPADIFNTPQAFVIHVALPGTKKEDIGVNWNPDSNTLNIAGVVHRPGDEEFIQAMVSGERKVGMFERSITLPPPGVTTENEDVDGLGITAKMEDGILIVTVPKIEKEWTEIRKVDIQ